MCAKELLERMGFPVVAVWSDDPLPRLCLTSSESLVPLIGTAGQHLQALEHLLRLMISHRMPDAMMPDFFLDINDYRKGHMLHLFERADAAAKRVLASGHAEALAPMNAQERKIIHTKLASSYESLQTQSIGVEPNRRVIIKIASLE